MKTALIYLFMFFAPGIFAQKQTHPDDPIICDPESADTIIRNGEIIWLHPDEIAQFQGGYGELKKYLAEQWQFFPCSPEFSIDGVCYLKLIISSSGKITECLIERSVSDCPECDKEALRIVKNMPDWIPAKKNGKSVASVFNLPFRFRF